MDGKLLLFKYCIRIWGFLAIARNDRALGVRGKRNGDSQDKFELSEIFSESPFLFPL